MPNKLHKIFMTSKPNDIELPDFETLKRFLSEEREAYKKKYNLENSEEIRPVEVADLILSWLQKLQLQLHKFFEDNPSLLYFFEKEFCSFQKFTEKDYILDVCFIESFLFPEKEKLYLGEPADNDQQNLESGFEYFSDWMKKKARDHQITQKKISEDFEFEMKEQELPCSCPACKGSFRSKMRDYAFDESIIQIEKSYKKIEENLTRGIPVVSELFGDLQIEIENKLKVTRNKLKRSSYNRLENQLKSILKEKFNYPSDIALDYSKQVKLYFNSILEEKKIKYDLIEEEEYDRFFKQVSSNLWRGERYLGREFNKLVKSILILKRQDISANILRDYLGEFWIHSPARRLNRKVIYHGGPTNSGKTYHAVESLCEASTGSYLAPLRLLAAELYDTMNGKDVTTSLLTGEEVINVKDSTHFSSTIEMAQFGRSFDACVVDEIQMISDSQRGWAWTRALVNLNSEEIHVCGDKSALKLVQKIVDLCGDTLEVRNYERMTTLMPQRKPIRVSDLEKGDALIVFSRRNALKYKYELEKCGFKVSIVYGRLSPEVRREQARKFDSGETDIIVSTDAIAMGMNLPIKRIVFSTLTKYINAKEFPISKSEIKQISGRAGRFNRYPTGYVNCLSRVDNGLESISEALEAKLGQKDKCMVGPDLDIFSQVNNALASHGLPSLKLSEFLRLFNTMVFKKPFYCVDLKEMIELSEMVEEADHLGILTNTEIFGFSCAPVNFGLMEHVQFFLWIVNKFARAETIYFEEINEKSNDIDYLETSIKCIELFQWLARHFNNKNFEFDEYLLLENKGAAIFKLNSLLSEKIVPACSSCGKQLEQDTKFAICEECYKKRVRFRPRGSRSFRGSSENKKETSFSRKSGKRKPHFKRRKKKR